MVQVTVERYEAGEEASDASSGTTSLPASPTLTAS